MVPLLAARPIASTADFGRFGPPQPLPINHLPHENRRTAGRIGEDGLVPLLAGAAARTEAARELADDVLTALHDARLFRVLLPRWLGGGESQPSVFIETIEQLRAAMPARPGACAR